MDVDIAEELNWFAEDPVFDVPANLPSKPSTPKPSKPRKSKKRQEDEFPAPVKPKKSKRSSEGRKHKEEVEPKKIKNEEILEVKKSKNDDFKLSKPSDLLNKPVKSGIEKLNLLEERDRLLRIVLEKEKLSTGKPSTKGVCPDMCPEKERILRDVRGIVATHEAYPDSNVMDHSRAVKEYARSSADQEHPLPHELRPAPVLRMTMDYLITEIICRLDDGDYENPGVWYDFCWGRLRAIRKDIIQQQCCDMNTVTIVEECARFHICCFDRLLGSPKSMFDDKINSETLMNCLKSLMYMYEDLRKQNKFCANEAEFRSYMILLKLHSGFVLSEYQQFPLDLQKSLKVKEAVDIHTAYSNNMYSTYFVLLKKTTYLNACLMQRFFGHLRTRALDIIVRSHCPPNKKITLSVSYLAQTLKFDSLDDCISFCLDFGLLLSEDGDNFSVSRNEFYFPETMYNEGGSSSLVVNKRVPVAQSVLGHEGLPKLVPHEVHSSFSADHFLQPAALDASDQEEKMLRDNVERTIFAKRYVDEVHADLEVSPSKVFQQTASEDLDEDDVDATVYGDSEDDEYEGEEGEVVYEEDRPEDLQDEIHSEDDEMDAESVKFPEENDFNDESDDSVSTDPTPPESPLPALQPVQPIKTPSPPKMENKFVFKPLKSPVKPPLMFPTFEKVNFQKMSQPFAALKEKLKSPERPPEEKPTKKLRADAFKMTQKTKLENEENLLMVKLRKKLSEKMKHVTAKKYAHIWRAKVEKIRKTRESQSVPLRHITFEDYKKLWGCPKLAYSGQTLDRLNKRKRANILVTALLKTNIIDQLSSKVKEIGGSLAEVLGKASLRAAQVSGNISQPTPVFWKLVLSLPSHSEVGAMFPVKLRLWCQTAFNARIDPAASDVCYWNRSGVPVFVHPVITEGLVELERNGKNSSAAVLVRAEGWESVKETQDRLNSLVSSAKTSISVAVLTLGTQVEPLKIEEKHQHRVHSFEQTSWENTNSFVNSLMKLAQNFKVQNLKVQSLGFLVEVTIENFLDSMYQDQYLNEDLSDYLTHPNHIINLYNLFIGQLEEEISQCCFFNFYGLACELQPLVKKLKNTNDIFPSNYEDPQQFKSALSHLMGQMKLSPLKWNFEDSIEFLSHLTKYCDSMGCSRLLSKIVRIINPPDRDSGEELIDYLQNVQWLPIVELLAKEKIDKTAFDFRVVYRDDKIRELSQSHWWLKSLR